MKSITIAGNVTKDAVLRTTQGGHNVAGFSVAVNGFENGAKTSMFFDVSLWGKRGESVIQFAQKGAKICVTGELGKHEHNGKTYLTVNASDFTPMGGGNQGQQSSGYSQDQGNSGYGAGGQGGGYGGASVNIDDDEIPFAPCKLI